MLKVKNHSCALCKPHKTGHANRWKSKELQNMKIFEKEKIFLIKNKLAEIDIQILLKKHTNNNIPVNQKIIFALCQ